MADGYISQIKTPDNKVYLLKDSEKTDEKVKQTANTEDKEFPIILKHANNATPETNGVKYAGGVTVNPSNETVTAQEFIGNLKSNKIIPITSKTYPAYLLDSNDDDNGILFFGDVTITDSDPWQNPWAVHYRLYVSTTEANTQGWYDCHFSVNGGTINYYNYNNFYSTSYRPIYNHSLLYPKNGQSAHGAHLGMRVYSSRTPTTLARVYKIELLEQINCTVTFRDSLTKYSELFNSTYYTYGEYNATSIGLQESGDTNTNDTASGYIRDAGSSQTTIKVAETLNPYLIILPDGDGITYHPINGANEDLGTDKNNIYNGTFNITQKIYYYPTDAVVAANDDIRQDRLWLMYAFNLRYSFNIGNTLTVGKEVYMVASLQSSTTATLRNPRATDDDASAQATGANAGPITQTLPTSEDGFIYIYLGRAYTVNTITLAMDHPIYWFKDGELRLYTEGRGLKSITRSGTTFTVTRDDGSTFDFTQQDTNKYHTSGSWGGTNNLTYTATAVNSADALAFTLETASTSAYGATKLSSATDSDSEVLAATPKAIKTLNTKMDGLLAAANAMVFKGVINATNALPNSHNAGDTYRVGTAGTYPIVDSNGTYCEVGTLIICITDGTAANTAHWTAVETNEDGAVISSSTNVTDNAIARFDKATGRIIQDSKVTIDDNGCITLTHTAGKSEELSIKYGSTIDYWWGVGTGNENHGLYDAKASKWILSAGEDNLWSFTGNANTATTATNLSAKPSLKASGNNITVTAGEKTSDAFTVPYATSAGYATQLSFINGRITSADLDISTMHSRMLLTLASSNMTTNKPPMGDGYIVTYGWDSAYWGAQQAISHSKTPHMAIRGTKGNSTNDWGNWIYLLDANNYTDYTVTQTGVGASGTWGISITGSAGSVAWSNVSERPTNVSSFTNDAGYLTSYTETDPTVPAWAKAATKPSYTANEVGALASSTVVTNVAISANITTNANYPIVFATSNKDTTAAKDEGLQKNSAKFYFNPSTGNVQATTFNGYTLAAASAKGVVTTIDTSANLPTSNAVKSFVEGKGYTTNTGTVTSVKLIQGAGITISSSGTAITTTGERTISITGMDATNGSTTKWLNQKGGWSTPTAANVGALASNTVVTNVAISANTVADDDYPIVFATSNTDTTAAKNEGLQKSGTKFFAHPSTGMLYATKFCVDESVTLQYNNTDKSLEFIF